MIERLRLELAQAHVASLSQHVLLTGAPPHEVVEDRDHWYRGSFHGPVLSVTPTGSGGGSRYRLELRWHGAGTAAINRDRDCDWRDFDQGFNDLMPADHRVLLDMSTFGFDGLIYLLRALDRRTIKRFDYCYVVPAGYDQDPILDLQHDIRQPKGYVELIDPEQRRAKLFLLGFDELRADRFLDTYDWSDDDLYVCIGDPGTVPDGFDRSRKALSDRLGRLVDRCPERVFRRDAADPHALEALILKMVDLHQRLDLMPLGPKPWTFAAASAYLKLRRGKPQGRSDSPIRILYDYGQRKPGRTHGVDSVVFGTWSLA